MEDIEKLSFVFMHSLGMDIKQGIGIDPHPGFPQGIPCQPFFVFQFNLLPFGLKGCILCKGNQLVQVVKIGYPGRPQDRSLMDKKYQTTY
jgi:hypothetical protein